MTRGWLPVLLASACLVAGCGTSAPTSQPAPSPESSTVPSSAPHTRSRTPRATAAPAPLGTVPPSWLGTRVLPRTTDGFGRVEPTPKALRNRRFTLPDTVRRLPGTGFASRVKAAPASVIARSTWKRGCPVAPSDLAWVRLTFWGFDQRRHTGELLVNQAVSGQLVTVFRKLYDAHYPIEEMRITRRAELDAPPTGDGNNTGAFNCRPVVGQTVFSQHAYGLAIDVDPFQNPYLKRDLVLPELASSYRDRGWTRPGMILPGGLVVRAFASIGWEWGGDWHSLKDLQHFSAGRRLKRRHRSAEGG
ncbi:MAG: M15 family metallopeptidase [Marmoricola sp.]